jgi:hypothetical protein
MSQAPKDPVELAMTAPVAITQPNEHGVFTDPLTVEFKLPGKAHFVLHLARSYEDGWHVSTDYGISAAGSKHFRSSAAPSKLHIYSDRRDAVLVGLQQGMDGMHVSSHGDAQRALATLIRYRNQVKVYKAATPEAAPVLYLPSQAFTLWGGESPKFAPTAFCPGLLKLHPLLERITMMPDAIEKLAGLKVRKPEHDDAQTELRQDWDAFLDDVKDHGVLESLKLCFIKGVLHVADGRHRLSAAQTLKLTAVPGTLVSEEEAVKIIQGTVIARRSWTKGMKAYFGVLMHPEVVGTKAGRPRNSDKIGISSDNPITRAELARRCGCSADTIDQACEIFAHCEKSKKIREGFEWRVFTGSMGLGGILAGIGAQLAGEEEESLNGRGRPETPWKHLCNGWDKAGRYLAQWDKLTEVQRETAQVSLLGMLKQLPSDLRDAALKELKAARA